MKRRKWLWLALLLGLSNVSQAAPATRGLIYIDPQEYTHEIKLWHFYYGYWFSQGEAVEPIALAALQPLFAETAMCEGNEAGDVVVWIKPKMFYNPHMTTFYGKIMARVYSGSGKLIGQYKGEAQNTGFLDVYPEYKVQATYAAAMRKVVQQMKNDAALQGVLDKGVPESETRMPCSMVSILPDVK